MTRTFKASEFKAKCLALLDEVAATGEPIVITKRGKVVARLSREASKSEVSLVGAFKGVIEITDPADDLDSALDQEDLVAIEDNREARAGFMTSHMGKVPGK